MRGKWLDAHRSAVVLNAVFLALTTWVFPDAPRRKDSKDALRTRETVRERHRMAESAEVLEREHAGKWQPSENVVEKIWANLRGDDAMDISRRLENTRIVYKYSRIVRYSPNKSSMLKHVVAETSRFGFVTRDDSVLPLTGFTTRGDHCNCIFTPKCR